MLEKMKGVSNPLTVISIFAGITEVGGTIVLPFLSSTNQVNYMWFLILFPTALVGMFFGTLNWNHRVLYAPSDYREDSSFLAATHIKDNNLIPPPTPSSAMGSIVFSENLDIAKPN